MNKIMILLTALMFLVMACSQQTVTQPNQLPAIDDDAENNVDDTTNIGETETIVEEPVEVVDDVDVLGEDLGEVGVDELDFSDLDDLDVELGDFDW